MGGKSKGYNSYRGIVCDKVVYERISLSVASSTYTGVTVDISKYGFSTAPKVIFVDSKNGITKFVPLAVTATSLPLELQAKTADTYTINFVLLENPQNYAEIHTGSWQFSQGETKTKTMDYTSEDLSDIPEILTEAIYGATSWFISNKTRTSLTVNYTAQFPSNYHSAKFMISKV